MMVCNKTGSIHVAGAVTSARTKHARGTVEGAGDLELEERGKHSGRGDVWLESDDSLTWLIKNRYRLRLG